jgi:hypothetical protein
MLLDNRVIASVGLADWTGTAIPDLFQSEVVGRRRAAGPVDRRRSTPTSRSSSRHGGALSPGARRRAREVSVPTDRFQVRDWFLLFGAVLLNGAVTFAAGLVPWLLRPRAPLPRALLMFGSMCALFLLTAMDLYGPARLFRLHVVGETFLPAAGIQLALLFPDAAPPARWRFAGYGSRP